MSRHPGVAVRAGAGSLLELCNTTFPHVERSHRGRRVWLSSAEARGAAALGGDAKRPAPPAVAGAPEPPVAALGACRADIMLEVEGGGDPAAAKPAQRRGRVMVESIFCRVSRVSKGGERAGIGA